MQIYALLELKGPGNNELSRITVFRDLAVAGVKFDELVDELGLDAFTEREIEHEETLGRDTLRFAASDFDQLLLCEMIIDAPKTDDGPMKLHTLVEIDTDGRVRTTPYLDVAAANIGLEDLLRALQDPETLAHSVQLVEPILNGFADPA